MHLKKIVITICMDNIYLTYETIIVKQTYWN